MASEEDGGQQLRF